MIAAMAKGDWTIWAMIIVGLCGLGVVVGLVIYAVNKLNDHGMTTFLVDGGR
jgi:hypothetical protein